MAPSKGSSIFIRGSSALAALCFVVFQGVQAEQETYYNVAEPVYKDRLLNWCLTPFRRCGLPVANKFCQSKGFSFSTLIRQAANVGKTRYYNSLLECRNPTCDGFKRITCVSPTFLFPSITDGSCPTVRYRLDRCRLFALECDKPAADAFCYSLGYQRAESFEIDSSPGQTTAIIGQPGTYCYGGTDSRCEAFKKIVCK